MPPTIQSEKTIIIEKYADMDYHLLPLRPTSRGNNVVDQALGDGFNATNYEENFSDKPIEIEENKRIEAKLNYDIELSQSLEAE